MDIFIQSTTNPLDVFSRHQELLAEFKKSIGL
jgi:hypothetical protein